MISSIAFLLVSLPLFRAVNGAVMMQRDEIIPAVEDFSNRQCRPWYEIRDVIMGDIFHGEVAD